MASVDDTVIQFVWYDLFAESRLYKSKYIRIRNTLFILQSSLHIILRENNTRAQNQKLLLKQDLSL